MNRIVVACLVVVLSLPIASLGIDRGARNIDSLGVSVAAFDEADEIGLVGTTEIAVRTEKDDWSVVAGGRLADVSPDGVEDDLTTWGVFLGMKHYLTRELSAQVTGNYRDLDIEDAKIIGVDLAVKQRFIPVDEVLSPYGQAGAALQEVDGGAGADSVTQLLLWGGFGCDVLLRDDMALVLEAGYSQAIEVSGDGEEYGDGFIAAVFMKYYWQ
jgi:hypothetical protein